MREDWYQSQWNETYAYLFEIRFFSQITEINFFEKEQKPRPNSIRLINNLTQFLSSEK